MSNVVFPPDKSLLKCYTMKEEFIAVNTAHKEGGNLQNLAITFVKVSLKPKLPINKQIIIRQSVNGKFILFNIFSEVDFVHLSP